MFMFDLTDNNVFKNIGQRTKKNNIDNELIVEYNNLNHAVFLDNNEKTVEIYDLRKEDQPQLIVDM